MNQHITTYKATDANMKCRDFQFELGKTYSHTGSVEPCRSGFHSCENPLDVLDYYPLIGSKFFKATASGEIKREGNKLCSASIALTAELSIGDFIKNAVDFVLNATKGSPNTSSGDYSKAASSGNSSTAASSGNSSTAASSGNYSKAASSGYSSTAASSGDSSTAASSGNSSTAASSGDYSTAACEGDKSVAAAIGRDCYAKASKGSLLVLIHYGKTGAPIKAVSAIPGKTKGIKPDTWYTLTTTGKLKEVK